MPAYSDLIIALRPAHWVKNFLVLAPLFFTGHLGHAGPLWREALAFGVFCAASSAVYLFNDWWDAPADREDERKRNRPYAGGRVPERVYWGLMAACAAAAAAGCVFLPWGVGGMVVAYAMGMALYTVLVKQWGAAGAVIIALGMIARVFAGAAAIGVCVSAWVLPCTFFLTCYVVAGKRLFDAAGRQQPGPDRSLEPLFFVFGAITLACYLFYAFTDVTILKYESQWVALSAAPVASGLWRYAAVVRRPPRGAEHFEAVLTDPVMAMSLCSWLVVFAAIIYR